mgnify:FL=1
MWQDDELSKTKYSDVILLQELLEDDFHLKLVMSGGLGGMTIIEVSRNKYMLMLLDYSHTEN